MSGVEPKPRPWIPADEKQHVRRSVIMLLRTVFALVVLVMVVWNSATSKAAASVDVRWWVPTAAMGRDHSGPV
jgi:hypothetical protein